MLHPTEIEHLEADCAKRFGVEGFVLVPVPRPEEIALRPLQVQAPGSLGEVPSADHHERLPHNYGQPLFDSVRVFARDFSNPQDLTARPRSEADGVSVLDWCASVDAVCIPWGGGSSVVGGVEPPRTEQPMVTLDPQHLNRVPEIDTTSQFALMEGGILGPALEQALWPCGHTLRHFPQSFEFFYPGGWIATRGSGHYATLHTHIDDFVQSLRVLTAARACDLFAGGRCRGESARGETPIDQQRDRRLGPEDEVAIRPVLVTEKPDGRERAFQLNEKDALVLLFDLALETAMWLSGI